MSGQRQDWSKKKAVLSRQNRDGLQTMALTLKIIPRNICNKETHLGFFLPYSLAHSRTKILVSSEVMINLLDTTHTHKVDIQKQRFERKHIQVV